MKIKLISAFVILIGLLSACKQKPFDHSEKSGNATDTIVIYKDSALQQKLRNEHMVLATLYHQKAAEYRALCYQAFNIGKLMLDADLADQSINQRRIVVLDVDETVLDNSPFQAKSILESTSYPSYWDEWCKLAKAEPMPGALEFLKYARSNGVGVFYVTNRKAHLKQVTIENLVAKGFPQADEEHVITRTDESSKEARRQELLKKYHISLLFGDNLNDFSEAFEGKNVQGRFQAVDDAMASFGKKFIILPNAMYGDWETALYGYNQKKADSVLFMERRQNLISF